MFDISAECTRLLFSNDHDVTITHSRVATGSGAGPVATPRDRLFGHYILLARENLDMPEAKLQLELPDDIWIGELSRRYPDATFTILAALSGEENGVGLTEIEGDSLSDLLEEMAAYEAVPEMEVLNRTDDRALVQFETTLPLLLLPARDSGVPLEMPFDLSDGTATWELQTSSDRLSELSEQLEFFDISFTVDYIQYDVNEKQLLTESQEETVKKAIEMGYYDTPRQCSLTDLAEEMDRAKSTISETLHRAEEKIIKQVADTTLSD